MVGGLGHPLEVFENPGHPRPKCLGVRSVVAAAIVSVVVLFQFLLCVLSCCSTKVGRKQ